MDCPNCKKPMKLLRESYEQNHHDPDCVHLETKLDDNGLERETHTSPDCMKVYAEYNCAQCQVGVHPELSAGKKVKRPS
jgi:hypothetical protein